MTASAPPPGACNLILCRERRHGDEALLDMKNPFDWIVVTRAIGVLGLAVNDFVIVGDGADDELILAARSAKARFHAAMGTTPADGVDLTATPVDGAQVDYPISTRHFSNRKYKEYGVAIWSEDDAEYAIESRDHRRDVMVRALARWREEHPYVPAILVERTITHTAFRRVEEQS